MEKIWKEITKIDFVSCEELLENLKKNNYKVSPWIEDIVKKNNYKFNNIKFPIRLVRKYVKDFGFTNPTELQKIWLLRKLLHPMEDVDAIEFLLDKLQATKNNAEFFKSMNR